jgi:hypothetical protein
MYACAFFVVFEFNDTSMFVCVVLCAARRGVLISDRAGNKNAKEQLSCGNKVVARICSCDKTSASTRRRKARGGNNLLSAARRDDDAQVDYDEERICSKSYMRFTLTAWQLMLVVVVN